MIKYIAIRFVESLDYVRYWEWYTMTRINMFAVLILFAFVGGIENYFVEIILYAIYIHVALAFGFLLNNVIDKKTDEQVGKTYIKNVSSKWITVTLGIFSLYLLYLPFYFNDIRITSAVILGLTIGISYSVKPIRLKERGIVGIILPMIAQHLPFILFYFIVPYASNLALYLLGWLILDGILLEFEQQIRDMKNDIQTKTKTYITKVGPKKAKTLVLFFSIVFILYMMLPVVSGTAQGITLTVLLLIFSSIALRHAQRSVHYLNQY